jgi:hypothetical protein
MSKKLRCNPSAGDCSSEEAFGTKIPFLLICEAGTIRSPPMNIVSSFSAIP